MVLLGLGGAGCGGEEVRLDSMNIHRMGWDTLRVAPTFEKASLFGGAVIPDSLTVLVSDRRGRTLYTGFAQHPRRPLIVPVPDPLLGDEAPFMLDLCGYFSASGTVCEQQMLTASPKRIFADLSLEYPYKRSTSRLQYDVSWKQERERRAGQWEAVPIPRRVPARLVLYVRGYPLDAVKLEIEDPSGTQALDKAPGYNDFWIRLHDPLLRGDSVEVLVQVESLLGSRPDSVTTLSKWVRPLSRGERREEVEMHANQALIVMLEKLETARDGRAVLDVLDWHFDPLQRAYTIQVWVRWSGGFLQRERYALEADLTVQEEDGRASMRVTRLSPDMQRLWFERVGSERLYLGRFQRP